VFTTLQSLPCVRQVQIDYDHQRLAVLVSSDQYDQSELVTPLWKRGYLAKPPLRPLLAVHGLWTLVLVGAAAGAAWKWPTNRLLRLVAGTLSVAGLAALAIVIGHDLQIANASVWSGRQAFIGPRLVSVIAMYTAIPATEVLLAGIIFGLVARWRKPSISRTGTDEQPADIA
jgi:hypothetical protein